MTREKISEGRKTSTNSQQKATGLDQKSTGGAKKIENPLFIKKVRVYL